ncbi:hypothetical protein PsorP6_008565 [Peronosclerospora sorghi]|uniref:Uncharacterized protein n=1 Tax=Peronosclerospora sorghi TaxID=230839 RepID=A0ACC0WDH6_9STRA|nr:hypothetical protein PsorP6_008565 [Peronosclerospora sorghi]
MDDDKTRRVRALQEGIPSAFSSNFEQVPTQICKDGPTNVVFQEKGRCFAALNWWNGFTNEDGLLEYLEDIIGSNVYVEPTDRVWDEVEQCNDTRGEKWVESSLSRRRRHISRDLEQKQWSFFGRKRKSTLRQTFCISCGFKRRKKTVNCVSPNAISCKPRVGTHGNNREELQAVQAVYQRVKSEHDEVVKKLDEKKSEYADFEKQDNIEQKEQENEELVPLLEKEVEKLQAKLKNQEKVLESILEGHKEETAKLRSTMESIQQEMEPFQAEMNALRSVIDTTETEIQLVEEPVTNAKKALEANSCSIIEPEAICVVLRKIRMRNVKKLRICRVELL